MYIFLCLLVIYISYLEKFQLLCPFLNWVICPLSLNCGPRSFLRNFFQNLKTIKNSNSHILWKEFQRLEREEGRKGKKEEKGKKIEGGEGGWIDGWMSRWGKCMVQGVVSR